MLLLVLTALFNWWGFAAGVGLFLLTIAITPTVCTCGLSLSAYSVQLEGIPPSAVETAHQ